MLAARQMPGWYTMLLNKRIFKQMCECSKCGNDCITYIWIGFELHALGGHQSYKGSMSMLFAVDPSQTGQLTAPATAFAQQDDFAAVYCSKSDLYAF